MKNPVQQMLKAGSQMKNNPQLAQREANSPNKVNAIAAQMVIPEQQAMQNSKPIPYPVGSVLMQKLAQAQQAALASQQPNPREGGIAQMAAKGGTLKFAKAGDVPPKKPAAKKPAAKKPTVKKPTVKKTATTTAEPVVSAPKKTFDPDVPMDRVSRGMSEASVSQNIKRKLAEPKPVNTTGLPPASDPIAEIKSRLDRANNAFKSGVKTAAKDAGTMLNDLDKLPAADRAKYAEFEDHLHRVLPSGSERATPKRQPGETDAQFVRRVSAEARKTATSALTPSELQAKAVEVTPAKMGELSQLQDVKQSLEAQQKANEQIQESNLRAPKKVIKKEVEGIQGLKKEGGISDALQLKRDLVADKLSRRANQPSDFWMLQEEELPDAIANKFARQQNTLDAQRVYAKTKADIERNREIAGEEQTRSERKESAKKALETQEGRPAPKPSPSRWTPNKLTRNDGRVTASEVSTAALRKSEGTKKSASEIGVQGRVVPKQPATPDQKARRSKLTRELNLPEKPTGIATAASKEARDFVTGERPIITPASPKELEPSTTRAEEKYQTKAERTGKRSSLAGLPTTKGPQPAISGTAKPAAPAEPAPKTGVPSKKKATDISMEEANARLERAARGETPATLHSKIEGITEGAIHGDPDVHAEVTKLATDFASANPDATTEQMGAHIMENASPETKAKFFSKAGPLLEKYGVKLGKAAATIGAYESAANIGNVAFDPTKSKKDVIRAAAHEAVQATPALVGSGLGAGAGSFIAPGPGTVVGGLAGGIAGAVGGDPAVRWMKEKLGMDQEGPQATAAHTIPTVGDAVDKVSEQFSGDNWNKSPRQRFQEEVAAMPEDEETLRLERLGRGEMFSDLANAPAPAAQTPAPQASPNQAPAGTAPAGGNKGITGSPALRTPAASQNGGASAPAGAAGAPSTTSQAPTATPTQDQYAGDTSEGTPEGAVAELMKLQGPGYQYSPEVMGMLKDAINENRARTALSMFAGVGAGLANRDRYAGAHDAALLANQAFTSGGEREDQAQQQFLQGIIHNERVPFEQRKAAYDMYTKMQMAAAQNEALYGRALLNAGVRRYGYDRQAESRAMSQRDQYASVAAGLLKNRLTTLSKEISSGMFDDATLRAKQAEYDAVQQQMNSMLSGMSGFSPALTGLADDQGLGQNPTKVRTL